MIIKSLRQINSTTHHFGFLNHNPEKKFGFIRISKSGSTSFTASEQLGLKEHYKIQDYKHSVYAAIRDPHSRFLSSIPETLARIKCCSERMKYPNRMNLEISNDIVDLIENSTNHGPKEIFNLFYELIITFGFFDAHHEPQCHFFTDLNLMSLNNINLFKLTNAQEAAQEIYSKHIGSEKFFLPIKNSGSKSETSRESFFKRLKQRKREIESNISKNPMYAWGIRNKIPMELIRFEFYNSLKKECSSNDFRNKINVLYKTDYKLIHCMPNNYIFYHIESGTQI